MDDWEKFSETSLTEKEDFYSHLNMEDITDADYKHIKRVCKDFQINNLGEIMICMLKTIHYCYHMYLGTFEICVLKIYEPDPVKLLSAPGLAWQAALYVTLFVDVQKLITNI